MVARRCGRVSAVHADDGDLHVDVMRFFAIIAMCLFAILPHAEAPKVQVKSDFQPRPNAADKANSYESKAAVAEVPAQVRARSSQRKAPSKDDQSDSLTDQDTRPLSTPIEQGATNKFQSLSVPSVGLTVPSQSEKILPAESAIEREEGVRFLNSDAFAFAVTSGAIALVYHDQNGSLVFEPAISRFVQFGDASLQIFGLAASEVPPIFHRGLSRVQRADMSGGQWFITLPEPTLAYLLDTKTARITEVVLNKNAQPVLDKGY